MDAPAPVPPGSRKLRGAYFTPEAVAGFLAGWAVTNPSARVLEPSAGEGAFARALSPLLAPPGRVDAVELDAGDARILSGLDLPGVRVVNDDVFAWYGGRRYDAVVGNPPFIRYQAFNGDRRRRALHLMAGAGLRPSRLTNAWAPFAVLAVQALRPGGRVALVLPAELTSVGYAAPLREWLGSRLSRVWLVRLAARVFGPAQQATVLLMGERGRGPARVEVVEVAGPGELGPGLLAGARPAPLPAGRAKWTRLWLNARQRGLLEDLERSRAFPRLGELAEVDVGVVTGANRFFVLRPGQARGPRARTLVPAPRVPVGPTSGAGAHPAGVGRAGGPGRALHAPAVGAGGA